MEILKEKILSYIKNSKEKQEVNLLLDELIKESKNRAFDVFRTVKKVELSEQTKQIFEKFIQRKLNTKEVLKLTGLKQSTFFKYLKEYKESIK